MKLRTLVFVQLAALCFVMAAYGFAADNAYLYIVHGIPGRDIADNLCAARSCFGNTKNILPMNLTDRERRDSAER